MAAAAAAAGADATGDKHKGHKRPHELIPDYIKSRDKIDVSVSVSAVVYGCCYSTQHATLLTSMTYCFSNNSSSTPCHGGHGGGFS